MIELLLFIAGVIVGVLFENRYHKTKNTEGTLKVRHDEDEAYLFLELSKENLDNIHKKDYVTLKVDITHE